MSGTLPLFPLCTLMALGTKTLVFSTTFWFALCLLFNAQRGLIESNEKGRRVKLRVAPNSINPMLFVRPSFLVVTFHVLTAKFTCSSYYAWKLNWVFDANCWSGGKCASKCTTDDSIQTVAFTGATYFTLLQGSQALWSRDFLSRFWVNWFCGCSFHKIVFEAGHFGIDRRIRNKICDAYVPSKTSNWIVFKELFRTAQ